MVNKENSSGYLIKYTLIAFGLTITLNYLLIRYTGDIFVPLAKAVLLFSGILIYGYSVNFFLFGKRTEVAESIAAGLIFTTFYFFLLSSFKLLLPGFIILFYLLPVPLFFLLLYRRKNEFFPELKSFLKRPVAEFGIFIFPFIYASLPSTFYDTLVYHLGIPNLYLLHHGFVETPQMLYANTSVYYEISLIPSLFAGLQVPRIFHFLIGIVFCLVIVDTASRFFALKDRFLLLLVLVSIPLTFFLITTVKNDMAGAFFILAGIRSYLKGEKGMSAVFWGFSIGIKYFNALPLVIFLFLIFVKDRFKNLKGNLKLFFQYAMTSLIILFPLFVKNYIFMKNPFFPFFTGYFGQGYFDISRYLIMKRDVGALIHSLKDIFTLPYHLSFREVGSGGLLGVGFLIFLPFVYLKRIKAPVLFLNFSLLLIFTGAFFTSSIRFMFIGIAILAIYTVKIFEDYETSGKKIISLIFFTVIALNIVTVFGYHERIYRAYYLYSGKMNVEEYRTRLLPTYSAVSYINRNSEKDSVVLVVGDTRNFYIQRKYHVSSAIDYSILKGYLTASRTYGEFISELKRRGIDYILYNSSEFNRLNRIYNRLGPEDIKKFLGFLKYMVPVFNKGSGYVYMVK